MNSLEFFFVVVVEMEILYIVVQILPFFKIVFVLLNLILICIVISIVSVDSHSRLP